MIVSTMNFEEINNEVNAEYEVLLKSSTTSRLTFEYLSERNKLKIKPQEKYIKFYSIKSKKKNNWLLVFLPKENCQLVRNHEDINIICVLNYLSDKGLRFVLSSPSKVNIVYNSHFFSRYKERLELPEINTLDIAKNFFSLNHHNTFQTFPKDENGCSKIIGILANGFALGELIVLNESKMLINYKTFISRDTANFKHVKSLFELEKIYKTNEDEESKYLYKLLGFDENKDDNSLFFEQWTNLREKVINSDEQQIYYQIIPS